MKNQGNFSLFVKCVSFNMLAMVGMSCYILADTFFVSKGMGENGLTALNLAIPVFSFMNGTGLMIGIGGATKYAVYQAQDKPQQAHKIFTHSICFGVLAGIFFLLVGMFGSEQLSRLLGSDSSTFAMTQVYLKTILSFGPMFVLNPILVAFVRNDGNPRLSMIAMLCGSMSNILLDYVFIFPCGMGIFGAAFATGLAPVISMSVLFFSFVGQKPRFRLVRCRMRGKNFGVIAVLGLSSLIGELSSGIVIIVFNMVILNLQGNLGVAAYGVVANLALVGISLFTGIAQGIQPILSTAFGAKDSVCMKTTIRWGLVTALLVAIIMYGVVMVFASPIAEIFNKNHIAELRTLASLGMRIYFLGFFFAGINVVLAAFFSAVEQPAPALMISLLRGCVAMIPLVMICAYLFGMNGVWISYVISEMVTCGAALIQFLRFIRK